MAEFSASMSLRQTIKVPRRLEDEIAVDPDPCLTRVGKARKGRKVTSNTSQKTTMSIDPRMALPHDTNLGPNTAREKSARKGVPKRARSRRSTSNSLDFSEGMSTRLSKVPSNTYTGMRVEYNPELAAAAFPTLDTPELTRAWYDQHTEIRVKAIGAEPETLNQSKDEKPVTVKTNSSCQKSSKAQANAPDGFQQDHLNSVKVQDYCLGKGYADITRVTKKPHSTLPLNTLTSQSIHVSHDPLPERKPRSDLRFSIISSKPALDDGIFHRTQEPPPSPRWDDRVGNLQERQLRHDMDSSDEARSGSGGEMLDPAHQRSRAGEMHGMWEAVSPTYKLHVMDMVSQRYSRLSQDTWVRLLRLTESQVIHLTNLQSVRQARKADEDAGRIELYSETRDFLLNDPKRKHLPTSAYKALQDETIFRNAKQTSHMSTQPTDLSNVKKYLRHCGLDPSLAELDDLECRPSSTIHKRAMQELAQHAMTIFTQEHNSSMTQQDAGCRVLVQAAPTMTSNSSMSPSEVTTRPTSTAPSSPGKRLHHQRVSDDATTRGSQDQIPYYFDTVSDREQ